MTGNNCEHFLKRESSQLFFHEKALPAWYSMDAKALTATIVIIKIYELQCALACEGMTGKYFKAGTLERKARTAKNWICLENIRPTKRAL